MNDWMKPDEAWWYADHRREPIKGTVLHSVYGTNNLGWFIPEGQSVIDGWTVLDAEGVAGADGVWYTEKKPVYVAREAMANYWKSKLDLAEEQLRTIKRTLEGLGIKAEEAGAE